MSAARLNSQIKAMATRKPWAKLLMEPTIYAPQFATYQSKLIKVYSTLTTTSNLSNKKTVNMAQTDAFGRGKPMPRTATIRSRKKIALIAHDNKKEDMLEWTKYNMSTLRQHELYATGTTGKLLETELDLDISVLESGPLGGDLQMGARISEGDIDFLIFFWDPLSAQPHDPDVKALLRVAVVWNIPIAMNRSSADFMISSSLMCQDYQRRLPNYETYRHRLDK